MAGWVTRHVDEIDTLEPPDLPAWKPLRHELGLLAFGVNAWVGRAPGDEVIEDHDELADGDEEGEQEELYFVARGRARFTVDGIELDAPAGTLIALSDPALRRAATAAEADTLVLAVGAVRGAAFQPSAWEARRLA